MAVQLPVERVRALCDPFTNPWTDEPFTSADVAAAIAQSRLKRESFSGGRVEWDRANHIERIAHLAVHGWADAIEIDVGIPSMGFGVEWPVQDGNHRLAAAIYRGDVTIAASVGGQVDYANELFGVDITEDPEGQDDDPRDAAHIPEPKIDGDWSSGPWEAEWQTRLIRQRLAHDCGVACLAMVTNTSYDEAFATFQRTGLDRSRKPYLSNFKELLHALNRHAGIHGKGLAPKMLRWRGWDAFHGIGILKIPNGDTRGWHWVVAERNPSLGVLVRDPAQPLVLLQHPILDVLHSDLSRITPYGCWIKLG